MKVNCMISCSVVAVILLGSMAFSGHLSESAMESTIGGGNCKECAWTSGPSRPCDFGSTTCYEYESCDYKVCETCSDPESECYNDSDVTAYYENWCYDQEAGCDLNHDSLDCSCHCTPVTTKGCCR